MYQPDHYRVEDVPQMHALMRARPLAALISCGSAGLYATHLPTVVKDAGPYGVIECHLAWVPTRIGRSLRKEKRR